MNQLNAALTWLTNLLFAPFSMTPLLGLLFWSAVTGVAMTYVFGKTSNQVALRRTADRVRAQLLAVKLFKDDLTVTLRCQIMLLKATGMRLLHSLPPTLVMLPPLVLVLTQLALRYEYRPLLPGENTVVELRLAPDSWEKFQNVELDAPEGVILETESVRDPREATLHWRIRPQTDQPTKLRWRLGEQTVEKNLSLAASESRLQPANALRPGTDFFDRLLYAGEPGFSADSHVQAISIRYERRATPMFGLDIPWWATFLIVSMLVAFLVRRPLGVEF